MSNVPWHMWVALGTHAQALILRDPERIVAILHWAPPAPVETLGGAEDGELEVSEGAYLLVAVHDPRDQLGIAEESDGATEPTSPDWPSSLLSDASREYFAKWGERS